MIAHFYVSFLSGSRLIILEDAAEKEVKQKIYQKLNLSYFDPVLDTLKWLVNESKVCLEITNLAIPQEKDSPTEFISGDYERLATWCSECKAPLIRRENSIVDSMLKNGKFSKCALPIAGVFAAEKSAVGL